MNITPEAEERRLWADYYEAAQRILEIMKREGTGPEVLKRIVAEQAVAESLLRRINKLHGVR